MPPIPPITQALLLINVGIFCLSFLVGGTLQALLVLQPLGAGFLPWQVVSYGFLHADMWQLFFNMLALWMFGAELEQLWGPKRYMTFLAVSVLSGALAFLGLTLLLDGRAFLMGFSSGIFGLLMATALIFPNRTIMPLFPPIPMKMKVFAIVFGLLELLIGFGVPGASFTVFSHLAGALGGFVTLRYWRGLPPFNRRRR